MVRAARPKNSTSDPGARSTFSRQVRDQQLANPDLHFINFRGLDKAIGNGRDPPPVDTVDFVEAVTEQICLVNTSFEKKRLDLLERIAGLRHALEGRSSEEVDPRCSADCHEFWQNACRSLVEVLDALTRLREYATFSCLILNRIHRRWSKQMPSDVQKDKNLQAAIQNLQAAERWHHQFRFYDGLEFAELYMMVEDLRVVPVLQTSSHSEALLRAPERPSSHEGQTRSAPEELSATLVTRGMTEVSSTAQCIACLGEINLVHSFGDSIASAPVNKSSPPCPSAIESCEAQADTPAPQFSCGHRMCQTCFRVGRTHDDKATNTYVKRGELAECAICKNSSEFAANAPDGIRSFRGILANFLDNLDLGRGGAATEEVGVLGPLAKHVDSHCEMGNT